MKKRSLSMILALSMMAMTMAGSTVTVHAEDRGEPTLTVDGVGYDDATIEICSYGGNIMLRSFSGHLQQFFYIF